MKQYNYKAVTDSGKKVEGVVEAKDEKSAINVLRDRNLLIISIKDFDNDFGYKFSLTFSKVTKDNILDFTRQFSTMIGSGLSMINALSIIKRQSTPAMSKLLDDIISSLESGESLYSSLSQHPKIFSPIYLSLVKAGEVAGVLNEVLEELAKTLEQRRDFRAKVKSSLMYPVIVMVAMIVVGIIMIFFVIPQLKDMYSQFQADIPITTTIVFAISEMIRTYWYIVLAGIVGAVFIFMSWLKTPKGRQTFDIYILRVPYIGPLIHKIIGTDIVHTLALLIKSGVSIIESLEIVALVSGNTLYRKGIQDTAKNVEKGVPLGASLSRQGFFPDMIIQMISVGEETGKLDDMMFKVAKQFQKDSLMTLKTLTSAIEPLMIIGLGIGVGIMVFSIIMPIYNITSQF